ncbi:MAG: PHP domain-containing protein [Anaerolineae bacterium]|nr:PHP domain-containing protein [Anaerolineae bacterium]
MTVAPDAATRLWVCDLHTHTACSRDSLTGPAEFLAACRRKGIDRVAVTDHNTVEGALRLKELDPERVIVGEEVRTTHGELLAYFLRSGIAPDQSPQATIDAVRAQDGVVGAAHPLDRFRREALGREALLPIIDQLDFLEVLNARCILAADNQAARALAAETGTLMVAGSDAHSPWEVGRAVTILPPFDSPATFLASLESAQLRGRPSPFWIHLWSTYAKLARRLGLASTPGA